MPYDLLRTPSLRSLDLSNYESDLQDSDRDYISITDDKCIEFCVKQAPTQLGLPENPDCSDDSESYTSKYEYLSVCKIIGGTTNSLYKVTNAQNGRSVIVRIFGSITSKIIDRDRERYICELLSKFEISKIIYSHFKEGQIEEWIDGRNLTEEDLVESKFLVQIAQNLKTLHSISIQGDVSKSINYGSEVPVSNLWPTIWKYYELCRKYARKDKVEIPGLDLTSIHKKMLVLEKACNQANSPVVLCHCDLLCGNIILLPDGNVRFIDFEYCCCMERAFDIANHFNEYMGFSLRLDYMPPVEKQREFIREYLKFDIRKTTPSLEGYCRDMQISDSDEAVDQLLTEISPFFLASNLFWGLWAVLQSVLSTNDFAYSEYAINRIKLFTDHPFWETNNF